MGFGNTATHSEIPTHPQQQQFLQQQYSHQYTQYQNQYQPYHQFQQQFQQPQMPSAHQVSVYDVPEVQRTSTDSLEKRSVKSLPIPIFTSSEGDNSYPQGKQKARLTTSTRRQPIKETKPKQKEKPITTTLQFQKGNFDTDSGEDTDWGDYRYY